MDKICLMRNYFVDSLMTPCYSPVVILSRLQSPANCKYVQSQLLQPAGLAWLAGSKLKTELSDRNGISL